MRLHSTFNINPSPSRHHPLVVLHATAKEHFHALILAALKASDCCHREHVLFSRVVNLMSASYTSTDCHKGVLAAGVSLGHFSISCFPISAAIAALLISDDEIEELVTSSDDGVLSGRSDGTKHPWQGDSMPFNRVPTYSNIGEPGGHLPHGENCVGS